MVPGLCRLLPLLRRKGKNLSRLGGRKLQRRRKSESERLLLRQALTITLVPLRAPSSAAGGEELRTKTRTEAGERTHQSSPIPGLSGSVFFPPWGFAHKRAGRFGFLSLVAQAVPSQRCRITASRGCSPAAPQDTALMDPLNGRCGEDRALQQPSSPCPCKVCTSGSHPASHTCVTAAATLSWDASARERPPLCERLPLYGCCLHRPCSEGIWEAVGCPAMFQSGCFTFREHELCNP